MQTTEAFQGKIAPVEYTLYCDESSSKGKLYADFYGGSLVRSSQLSSIEKALNAKKAELNLHGEIKWSKVTDQYLTHYQEMIRLFFEFVRAGDIRIRIMFRSKADQYASNEMSRKDN